MLSYLKDYFRRVKLNRLRKVHRPGETISRFIARDVKREVFVLSADEIEAGFVSARLRTINVLYLSMGLVQEEDFGPAERIEVEKLWEWSGKTWGGLPDGTSIVDHTETNSTDSNTVGQPSDARKSTVGREFES
ncbi:hypothetical protein VN12_25335 [Pirellula sp. SH-Sr6A]|uniref:hypothetical protein n=1 Tax=Pirellula sp. SH-Sr6A TaxID=1632865 RepID=UPI00078B1AF0|nr:hypothetical protein [Pirellula sp. SH-Sr6A]AMV35439.1 hypothetical protein VN12_25335 [Pirellula sp. SH-Sr6A]